MRVGGHPTPATSLGAKTTSNKHITTDSLFPLSRLDGEIFIRFFTFTESVSVEEIYIYQH